MSSQRESLLNNFFIPGISTAPNGRMFQVRIKCGKERRPLLPGKVDWSWVKKCEVNDLETDEKKLVIEEPFPPDIGHPFHTNSDKRCRICGKKECLRTLLNYSKKIVEKYANGKVEIKYKLGHARTLLGAVGVYYENRPFLNVIFGEMNVYKVYACECVTTGYPIVVQFLNPDFRFFMETPRLSDIRCVKCESNNVKKRASVDKKTMWSRCLECSQSFNMGYYRDYPVYPDDWDLDLSRFIHAKNGLRFEASRYLINRMVAYWDHFKLLRHPRCLDGQEFQVLRRSSAGQILRYEHGVKQYTFKVLNPLQYLDKQSVVVVEGHCKILPISAFASMRFAIKMKEITSNPDPDSQFIGSKCLSLEWHEEISFDTEGKVLSRRKTYVKPNYSYTELPEFT